MPEGSTTRLQRRLGHTFSDPTLLALALTHRSAGKAHNERLEFLGDAILGGLVAAILYERYPGASEGDLSRMRSALVNRRVLAELARELELGGSLLLGAGERKSGGRERDSILCDAMEAVIGAVYLDGGFAICKQLVTRLFADRIKVDASRDPKTELQELMQARGLQLPVYDVLDIKGEEHDQEFFVSCTVAALKAPLRASGSSRRDAERRAAALALGELKKVGGIRE